jgi:hypothetical protein
MPDVSICSRRSQFSVTVLALRQTQNYLAVLNKSNLPCIAFPSRGRDVQHPTDDKPSTLLTLDETIGVLENLRCGCWSLDQGELIQLLQRHFDVILSQKLLSES